MHRCCVIAVALVALAAPTSALADADSQIWMAGGVSHGLGERTRITIEQQVRLDDNVSRLGALMPEAGLDHDPIDWLRLGTGYRLSYERDGSGDLVLRHRVHADARARVSLGPVRVGYRLRFQEQIRGPDGGEDLRHTIRSRLGFELRSLKPLRPGADVEMFHGIATPDGDDVVLNKIRVTVGTEYALGEQDLAVYYRLELPRADPDDPVLHIFGVEFHAPI